MEVEVRHVADCPHAAAFGERVREALAAEGVDAEVRARVIETLEEAERLGFTASPTVAIDGMDAFGVPGPPALACLPASGVPTPDAIRAAIARRRDGAAER